MKRVFILLLVLSLITVPVLAEETVTVKVGVVGSTNEQWTQVLVPALAKEGINIELVEFSDYVMPNIALAQGDIDMNAFQHYNFLNNWNNENSETYGCKLAAIGETLIAPLSLYSAKYASIEELKDGDTIAIMNDPVNEARALRVLEANGIITLSDDITENATIIDIVENPLNLKFYEVDASMVGSMLPDPSIAVGFMNGQYATQAGYAHESAILVEAFDKENPEQHGIINVIAVREEDQENETYLRIAEAYQCDEVKEVFDTLYAGSFLAAW